MSLWLYFFRWLFIYFYVLYYLIYTLYTCRETVTIKGIVVNVPYIYICLEDDIYTSVWKTKYIYLMIEGYFSFATI